ncbi:MAG: hypothetical protein JO117_11025, partial [Verrucomicrobia bacterium]|nr:hypothetical protein [Verrucomicrobiota bacterium]
AAQQPPLQIAGPTPDPSTSNYPIPGMSRTRATTNNPALLGGAPPKARVTSATAVSTPVEPLVSLTPLSDISVCNAAVLEAIRAMPTGGGYSASHAATERLRASISLQDTGGRAFSITPTLAKPSYCSSATYLVFLKAVEILRRRGDLRLDDRALGALLVNGQRDGEGVWGRWNANGPGTARLFHELGLGENFIEGNRARPGDFMKIFWTPAIGKKEHGHSVVFLGRERAGDGTEWVHFWSSNQGVGYGDKRVPATRIKYAIYSRLEDPRRLETAADSLPPVDPFLASLLTQETSTDAVRNQCGL